ncbi:MobQ family relaxase [Tahibacter aquaticus]|nr:MobQ family relaxase [Tahibacter aquaticus]
MAIFYVDLKVFSRSQGHTATAAAAYRAGVRIKDERTGLVHDYRKRTGVVSVAMRAPADAPEWACDPFKVWSAAEMAELRANARVARELLVALPAELDASQRSDLAEAIAQSLVDRYGVAVMIAIHGPGKGGDDRNHHAHLLMTTRTLRAEGFGPKVRQLDDQRSGPEEVRALRQLVAALTNHHLQRAVLDARVDFRSLDMQAKEAAERGDVEAVARLARLPQRHEGKAATAALRRGEHSGAREANQQVSTDNRALSEFAQQRAAELRREREPQRRARKPVAGQRSRARPTTFQAPAPRPRRLAQESRDPYLAGLAETVAFVRRLSDETVQNDRRRARQAAQDLRRATRTRAGARLSISDDCGAAIGAALALIPEHSSPPGSSNGRTVLPPIAEDGSAASNSVTPEGECATRPIDPRATASTLTPASEGVTAVAGASATANNTGPREARPVSAAIAEPRSYAPARGPQNRREWAQLRRQQRAAAASHVSPSAAENPTAAALSPASPSAVVLVAPSTITPSGNGGPAPAPERPLSSRRPRP